jgi:hypothetical protein
MNPSPTILERLTRVAPLGLQFWDPVTRSPITEGLVVSALPKISSGEPGPSQFAIPNRSGVFVFHHLPGLREAEFGTGDAAFWATLPPPKFFQITVTDLQRHFLPFQFEAQAPFQKLFQGICAESPPAPPLPDQPSQAIPLFSTPIRPVAGGLAVIRTTLVTGNGAPAAWALLEASSQGELLARGMADAQGRVALFFPYPSFVTLSPLQPRPPLTAQVWPLELSAFFTLSPPSPFVPDLCQVLAQPPVTLLWNLSPPIPLGQVLLEFGKELIVKTDTKSELWLNP